MSVMINRRASVATSCRPAPVKTTRPALIKRIVYVRADKDISGGAEDKKDSFSEAVQDSIQAVSDKAQDVAYDVKAKAGALGESTKESATGAKDKASDEAGDIKDKVTGAGEKAKGKVEDVIPKSE